MLKRVISGLFSFCLIFLLTSNFTSFANQNKKEKLPVLLFFSKHCGACLHIENEFLPSILKKYGDIIALTQKEISEKSVLEELTRYNKEATIPTMVIGNKVLVGSKQIEENLPKIIQEFLSGKFKPSSLDTTSKKKLLMSYFIVSLFL